MDLASLGHFVFEELVNADSSTNSLGEGDSIIPSQLTQGVSRLRVHVDVETSLGARGWSSALGVLLHGVRPLWAVVPPEVFGMWWLVRCDGEGDDAIETNILDDNQASSAC